MIRPTVNQSKMVWLGLSEPTIKSKPDNRRLAYSDFRMKMKSKMSAPME